MWSSPAQHTTLLRHSSCVSIMSESTVSSPKFGLEQLFHKRRLHIVGNSGHFVISKQLEEDLKKKKLSELLPLDIYYLLSY